MKPSTILTVTGTAIVAVVGVNVLLSALWVERLIVLVVLLGASLWLSGSLALVTGIVAMLADLITLSSSPDSLSILFWVVVVVAPFYLASRVQFGGLPGGWEDNSIPDPSPGEEGHPSEDLTGEIESLKLDPSLQSTGSSRERPVEDVRNLVRSRLGEVRGQFEFDNALLYRMVRKEARLRYVVASVGEVDRERRFRPDTGQGVGWVLRHRDRRRWAGPEVDWRTLRYHKKNVDLREVLMEPLFAEGEFVGVLVMEWVDPTDWDEEELETFASELALYLRLEVTVKRLQRSQNQHKLMEELHRLNPVNEPDLESLVQRALGLVGDYIPADNIEFYRHREGEEERVLHQGRRQVYEECMEWIRDTGEVLRIDDVSEERLRGNKLARGTHLTMRSFLGGAVNRNDDLYGMICLDHSDPRYFTVEDERLLGLLLNQLSQALTVRGSIRELEEELEDRRDLVDLVTDVSDRVDLEARARLMCDRITDGLASVGTAVYWRREASGRAFERIAGPDDDEGVPPSISPESSLVRSLRSHPDQPSVTISDLSRLDGMSGPDSAGSMLVLPAFTTGTEPSMSGFVVLFFRSTEQLREWLNRGLSEIRTLLVDQLRRLDERESLRRTIGRDPRTGVLTYDAWKDALTEVRRDGSFDRITLWLLRVPGQRLVIRQGGISSLEDWLERLGDRLTDAFDPERVGRVHGTIFCGFDPGEPDRLRTRLETVAEEVRSIPFPTGDWPRDPVYRLETFDRPFPGNDRMVEELEWPVEKESDPEENF